MATLYRPLADLLREAGCRFERQDKGSHEIWYSPIMQRTFIVPSNIDGRPLANAILKRAGLPRAFQQSWLPGEDRRGSTHARSHCDNIYLNALML